MGLPHVKIKTHAFVTLSGTATTATAIPHVTAASDPGTSVDGLSKEAASGCDTRTQTLSSSDGVSGSDSVSAAVAASAAGTAKKAEPTG